MQRLIAFVPVILFLMVMPTSSAAQTGRGDRPAGAAFASRSPVMATHAMAATSHPLATQTALQVLRDGGTAVDAAIAANAVLGLVEPNNCGPGGDLFAIVWDAGSKRLVGLNASGRAAHGTTLETLRQRLGDRRQIPLVGPLAVSVPGAVDGWFMLHDRFGRLPMDRLLAPAIAYAEEGVPVTQVVAAAWPVAAERFVAGAADMTEIENFRRTFLPDGEPPKEGSLFRNPDLARTYSLLARGGRDVFYRGEIADRIDAFARRSGMLLRKEDFERHTGTWVDPVSVNYRGYDVFELPPNGQGIAVLQMLQILEGFDLKSMGHNSADYLHVLVEAKKLAFDDRARYYADPEFSKAPLEHLLSDAYATEQRRRIDMTKASERLDAPELRAGDTVYLTVADAEGNIVSLIQSNAFEFGSGMVPDGLGFPFQNRGSQFNLDAAHPNAFAPGKRPFHTIIPGFVLKDGEPYLSFGVMGGAFQPQGHVQVLCNIIDFGMNIQEAGDAARFSHANSSEPTGSIMTDGGRLALESGIAPDVRAELARRGHRLAETDFFGGYQAIRWDPVNRVYWGASEMRKDGQAAGF